MPYLNEYEEYKLFNEIFLQRFYIDGISIYFFYQ